MGISLQMPKDWTVIEIRNENCIYPNVEDICLTFKSPDESSSFYILIVNNDEKVIDDSGFSLLSVKDIERSFITPLNDEITLIRSWWANAPSYGMIHYEYLNETLDLGKVEEDIYSVGNWIISNNKAYSLSYIFNQFKAPTPDELKTLESVKIMDNILLTLDIEFEANPFEYSITSKREILI